MSTGARNVNTIKYDNRALIFGYVRQRPVSRAEISKRSGMSKSAVTMITNALIEEGQLCEVGVERDTAYGRKPILLDIVPNYRFCCGITLSRSRISVCITDLKSNILAYKSTKTESWDDPYKALDWAMETVLRLADENEIPRDKLIGVGVSSPGPVDYKTGVVLNPPNFELFHNIPVGAYLREKMHMPVLVDTDSVLMTMQERYLCETKYENFMFLIATRGIGSAVMCDGKIFRGKSGFSGEIGHTSIYENGIKCSCGNRGCLEKYVTMKALKEKFDFDSYEQLVDEAYLGDSCANDILEYVAHCYASAIVNAVNLFDLDAVAICGDFAYRSDKLCEHIKKEVNERSIICHAHEVNVYFSKMTSEQVNSSVTASVLSAYFEQNLQ